MFYMNSNAKIKGTTNPAIVNHHPQRLSPRFPFKRKSPEIATNNRITAITSLTHFQVVPSVALCNLFIPKISGTPFAPIPHEPPSAQGDQDSHGRV